MALGARYGRAVSGASHWIGHSEGEDSAESPSTTRFGVAKNGDGMGLARRRCGYRRCSAHPRRTWKTWQIQVSSLPFPDTLKPPSGSCKAMRAAPTFIKRTGSGAGLVSQRRMDAGCAS
jgi:hypothetical protein